MSASKTTSQLDAADRRNKLIAVAAGVVMLGIVYYELQGVNDAPAAPAAQVAAAPAAKPATTSANTSANTAGVAKTVGNTAAALDPTLHMQAMLVTESVAYTGSGRNIFAGPGEAREMAAIPKPIMPVRPNTAPQPPRAYTPPQPPGPPPIELKFFGMATSPDGQHRQAFLLHADDVFLASKGDIVQRKYRVIDIGPNSIQIEDMSNNNRQTLPLQAAQ